MSGRKGVVNVFESSIYTKAYWDESCHCVESQS